VDETYLGSAILSQDSTVEDLERKKREAISADPKIAGLSKEILMEKGKRVFSQTCFACHQMNGEGIPGVFPPLAKSDFLLADKNRAITTVIKGLSGPIKVNGKDFNGVMPPVAINDEQVAQVLTYVHNEWGNTGDIVTVDEVRKVRAESAH
jgi:nitrite reductase (NO-forming)